MKLTKNEWLRGAGRQMMKNLIVVAIVAMVLPGLVQLERAGAQSLSTTTVQGTMYLANGQAASGTLRVSWPAFTTANGQAVTAGSSTVTIAPDGFVSMNLAPNVGATPAGLYYTAIFYMSDGTTNTQYWVVPAAAQATLAQVQSQVMPAAQAVQAVSKAYVDQTIATLNESMLTASGGSLSGPLYLNGDPTQPMQAADKHYVDSAVSQVAPISLAVGSSGQIAYYTGNGSSIGGMSTVPLASGGTGSATAAGALQNLGGISATATSPQTIAGPLNANVNGVFAVTVFGAKGDCTGSGSTSSCTDNYSAIQAAINAAALVRGSVYFPSNPASTNGQTVYYTSQALDPKGVSMFGPVGAGGPAQDYAGHTPVAVLGAPGKDVFEVPDPATAGPDAANNSFTVQDLAIFVDNSVDASANFPTRRPGRSVTDAHTTASSGVVTSATAEFQPGDVGQAVTVSGAGASGATLSTTIASWQSATQVTLTAAASTAVTTSTMYISVFNLPTTQNIGNCGFAYDASTSAATNSSFGKSLFINVVVEGTDNFQNNDCGFFFQGNIAPGGNRWENDAVVATFPFNFVPASNATPTLSMSNGISDFNVFDRLLIEGAYPFLAYDSGFTSIRDTQIYSRFGPHILAAYGVEPQPFGWRIDIPELETGFCTGGEIGFRIAGQGHTVDKFAASLCGGSTLQWDASQTTAQLGGTNSVGPFNITGSQNVFSALYNADMFTDSVTVNDTGRGNILITGGSGNPLAGIQPARQQAAGGQPTLSNNPTLSRPALAFARTHDFLNGNASTSFFNAEDLWIWPTEVDGLYGPDGALTQDSTSGTGWNMLSTSSAYTLGGSNGSYWVIGQQFPAGKVRIYFKAKIATAGNWYAAFFGSTVGYITSCSPALTTSYSVASCDVDLTGLAGQQLQISLGGSGLPATNVNWAWIGVRPIPLDAPVTTLQLASGTAMTANHGTGTSLQHSDGTGTSGACFFAADGSCTATAGAIQNGATATTQSAGDNSTKIATDAFVLANAPSTGGTGLTPYGTIFSANTTSSPTLAASLPSFTSNGVTPTTSGGALVFAGGGGNFTQTLDYNYNTQLPIWTIDATYTVGTPGATTWGIGFGLRSNASSGNYQPVDMRMDASTAPSAGYVTLESGPSHTQLAPASPEVISFNAGDTIRSYLTRVYDTISGFVLDVNTGSIANVSYQYVFNSSASGASNNAPNIGTFSIYNLGGTQTLTSLKISSGLPKGADLACLGDSKTVGYWAGSYANGWCMQLQGSFKAYQLAGGYGQSADLLADVPETIALAPKYAIVMTGGNDRRYGVPLSTTESNIATAVSNLQAANITVYVATYPVENSGVNMASLNSWILSTYPTNSIDINNGFSQTGSGVPAAWLSSDGIHPSGYFHSAIAQQIATRLQHDAAKQQFPFYVTP